MVETTVLGIQHIVKTPGVLSGSPRIDGRRISVHMIADQYVNHGVSIERLAESFELTPAQIHAALAYYYDHRAEIDVLIAENDAAMERSSPYTVPEAEQQALREQWRAAKQARIAALPDPDREMTVSEAAQVYGISAQAIREACKEGWIPARKSGAAWLIRHADAEKRWGAVNNNA
jgi:excisionase family DNA binding protein